MLTETAHRTEQDAAALAGTLPALLVEAERIAATVAQGVHGRRRVGSGESFWQFRRYQPGETAGRIDWRQSAKTDSTYIRENEWDAAESVWLWCDRSASMEFCSPFAASTKMERARLILIALAMLLIRGGERIAALDAAEPPGHGRAAQQRFVRWVLQTPTPSPSLPPARLLPRHSALVLAGDFLEPAQSLLPVVQSFFERGVRGHMLQILDPAEEDLPYSGRTRFESPEAGGALTVGRAEDLREDYRKALAIHRDALRDIARRFGWTFVTHRTDRAPHLALLSLHAQLSETRAF